MIRSRKAQSLLEYALLVAAVALAFSTMFYYARRSALGRLKILERQINLATEEEDVQGIR